MIGNRQSVDDILTASSSIPARPLSPTQAVETPPTSSQAEQNSVEDTPSVVETTPLTRSSEGSASGDGGAKVDNSDENGNSVSGGETAESSGELLVL